MVNLTLAASRLPQAYPRHPPYLPSTPTRHTVLPPTLAEPTHPHTAGPIQPSTPPLPTPPAAPSFASVIGSRPEQPQSVLAVQDGGADFTIVYRKKMRMGATEGIEQTAGAERNGGKH